MAKQFTLTITLGNSTRQSGSAVADALRGVSYEIADRVGFDALDSHHAGTIYSPDRKKVGTWRVTGQ